MLQLPLIILAIIAGITLGILGNWVYDLLKVRGFLSANPTRKHFIITLLIFFPAIILVALPELLPFSNSTPSQNNSSPQAKQPSEDTNLALGHRDYESIRIQQGQMILVTHSDEIALIRFIFNPEGAAYQYRYRSTAAEQAEQEVEGTGLLYEDYERTPIATSEYQIVDSGSRLEIEIGDMQLLWSSGGSNSGWIYFADTLAVEVHNDSDFSTFDLTFP